MGKRTRTSETAGGPSSQGDLNRTPLKTGVMLAFWGGIILLCWIYRDSLTVENIVNYVPENTAAAICIMLMLFALKGITVIVTGPLLQKVNTLRLDMEEDSPYINSGVMLMNLALLRREQNFDDVFHFIKKRKNLLVLPDQDIISGLYGSRIYARYNMTEWLYQMHAPFETGFDLDWVWNNSVIIHYCGRNKSWKENYVAQLDVFYKEAAERLSQEA